MPGRRNSFSTIHQNMNFAVVFLVTLAQVVSISRSFQWHAHRPSLTSVNRYSIRTLSPTTSRFAVNIEDTIPESEIRTLYSLLSDKTLLFDPSRGQCCRSKCSGCVYLDGDGSFSFDEYSSNSGYLSPYVKVDFGNRVHTSKWSKILFPDGAKEVARDDFANLLARCLGTELGVSDTAISALWTALSPSAGYPKLSTTEIIRAIKGMDGSMYELGGAVDYDIFERAMLNAVETLRKIEGSGFGSGKNGDLQDYDSMTREELLDLCEERGMKTNFPKMKRIIIEELRFFDVHRRQGKRHPVKNTLS
mmetsp:Transcript_2349/g.5068  ORF Transcript_2349/g.5068 Transcript_2349/m.5068 type:complete len:305 (+) Transcript_2349:107-1021(+)